jgi:hypothetical protein
LSNAFIEFLQTSLLAGRTVESRPLCGRPGGTTSMFVSRHDQTRNFEARWLMPLRLNLVDFAPDGV